MAEKIPCSVGILTLNSAKHLTPALKSLEDFADVFLLDGNSMDGTQDIARQYGRLVYKQVETDEPNVKIANFTAMRRKSIELSRCEWIFLFDSDEIADPPLVEEIREAVKGSLFVGYNIQKKYLIRGKKIKYCFNYPNYYLRLFSKTSGIGFKGDKVVHEQIHLPEGISVVNMKGAVYSAYPDTYRDCVKKDDYYLALACQNMFPGKFKRFSRPRSLKNAFRYLLRAGNILYKTLKIYFRHGYSQSLPFLHAWRHVRYHLIISWYCIKQMVV